jgi:molybdate transport system substrate-binding protein
MPCFDGGSPEDHYEGNLMKRLASVFTIAVASLLLNTGSGTAADVKVLCAEAMKPVFPTLAADFERKTASKVAVSYATAGVIEKQIQDGEAFDVVILPTEALNSLATGGKIVVGTSTKIAQSPLAIAVHAGSPKPDITTVDAVKRALLAAKSIGYSDPAKGGAIGKAAARMIARLGLTDELKSKTMLTPAGQFVSLVGEGRIELAIALPIVLMNRPGVDFVGVLPTELQDPNAFIYSAAISANSEQTSTAKALVGYMTSPEAAGMVKSKGMKPAGEL